MTARHLPIIFILCTLFLVSGIFFLLFFFSPWNDTAVRLPPPATTPSCIRTGCYDSVCSDTQVLTECGPLISHYLCYDHAVCERQENGECGWTETREYDQCLEEDYPQSFILIPNVEEKKDNIAVMNLTPNQVIPSDVRVEGRARGTWFFEATFPVRLVDDKGKLLSRNYAEAAGEWMTENFVPFRTAIVFEPPTNTDRGYILLEKDNPSGMPKFGDMLVFPVRFR